MRKASLVLAAAASISCAPTQAPGTAQTAPTVSSNSVLTELAREDQAYRRGAKVERRDEDRARLVLAELAKGSVRTPEDKANAALVLQHTGMTFCGDKLVSLSPDNYLLAHELAKSAFEAGH
jgi:hypothetical protein